MRLLLSHWHCILPAAVILIALLSMNRGQKRRAQNAPADRSYIEDKKEIEL
ncbi:MAG TPA: hypothetical protein VN369_00085 [Terriglobales bacterium]|nr:hypothetical protein [Terriglobales bacterium]